MVIRQMPTMVKTIKIGDVDNLPYELQLLGYKLLYIHQGSLYFEYTDKLLNYLKSKGYAEEDVIVDFKKG